MFEHTTFNTPSLNTPSTSQTATLNTAAQSAVGANAPNLSNPDMSNSANGGSRNDRARERAIADQIDLSIKASKRLEEAISTFRQPVFQVETNPLDAFNALKPALSEAQTRLNRDAFIVLSMMGIPPEKAREIANAMTGGSLEDVALSGANGSGATITAKELALNVSGSTPQIDVSAFRVMSQRIEIDLTQIESRFSSIGSTANISISEFRAQIDLIRIDIAQAFQQDPLILDLDGNGIDITSLQDGQQFDIDGDGTIDQTAWIRGNDALLALDRNKDGKINNGTELFGDQNGAADGFGELAKFDDNQDGKIDANDAVFSALVLLRANGEQATLMDEGITSISLSMITPIDQRLIGGDLVATSHFTRDDGSIATVGEVLFDVKA
ncbi:hypothetical protein [Thalassospira lucentensis]|uniref:EF-hand domain-containing protein n=1 Tax=Thalassospira lucentensis TaxID=168935 RepID=A0A358HST7_9PROT|nr:hypothetical protein [Thalassospira lucentensis]HBU98255.1 hypothetical protein [Thalassospira lucentensis]